MVYGVTVGAPANRLPYSDGGATKVMWKSIIISQFYRRYEIATVHESAVLLDVTVAPLGGF